MQVTLAKPGAGLAVQPRPGTQPSTVHGSPSSHAAVSVGPQVVAGSVVVVGMTSVVVVGEVDDVDVVVVD